MTLVAELEALKLSLSCCRYWSDQHEHILIKEDDVQATLRQVKLLAQNGQWFSFDPDRGRGREAQMSPLLTVDKKYDHHRACDCVVLVAQESQLTALYIDMKSRTPAKFSGQFKSTRQFVRYALGLLEDCQGHKLSLLQERFVVLYGGQTAPLQKRTTVPRLRNIGKTQPDKPYKRKVFNGGTIYLKELLK